LLLELTAALGIAAIFVIAHRWPGVDQASLIAACLLLGRLLPYLVSTRQSLQQLRSAGPALELWQRYMDLASARSSSPATHLLASRDGLHIQRLRVSPPSKGLELSNLWLLPGEMTVVSGNSGIGKSSLVDVMAGMTPPQEFTARVHGRSIGFGEYRELVSHGAYVSQSVRPWQRSVRECLLWAATDVGDDVLWCALADVGLETLLVQSERGLDTALFDSSSKLSGGELQRLMLAQVILRQPYLALLDEATSALDAAAEMQVLSTLRHRLPQTIMIVVSHRHGVATIADQQLLIGPDLRTCVTRLPQSDNAIPKFRIREG
jgi:ATP-binding cassette subfamily C protein